MIKGRRAKAAKAAAKRLPAHLQDVAFTKRTGRKEAGYQRRRLGKFGAASEVRRINPADYKPG